jgi:catechol 2,3-dioxygenase-like lactoylglutathione lyase family enzyme
MLTADCFLAAMQVQGINHLVIEVKDLKGSEEFYCDLLGFEPAGRDLWPDCGRSLALRAASGQQLVLAESEPPRSLPETGTHQAYRVAPADRETIARKLSARAVKLHTYNEDRPAEKQDNFYFYDPDGNRIQLIARRQTSQPSGKVLGIDHAAVECYDLEWAEAFYAQALGLPVDHRTGWRTADYARAKLWGEGKEEMAPGTRRWDQRYTTMEQKRRLPRPNMQLYVRAGDGVLGVYLALEHRQEPPEEQMAGTPRIGLRVTRDGLQEGMERLSTRRFPFFLSPFAGPVEHPASAPVAASLYFKDLSSNFLELCVAR